MPVCSSSKATTAGLVSVLLGSFGVACGSAHATLTISSNDSGGTGSAASAGAGGGGGSSAGAGASGGSGGVTSAGGYGASAGSDWGSSGGDTGTGGGTGGTDAGFDDPDPVITADQQAALKALHYSADAPPQDPSNKYASDPKAQDLGQRLFFDGSLSGRLL